MKTTQRTPLLATSGILLFIAVLVGCQKRAGDLAALTEGLIVGPEYSANKGLYVPEETRKSLGLKIVDATEDKLPGSVELSLRVYELHGDHMRASGTIGVAESQMLTPGLELDVRMSGDAAARGKVMSLNDELQKATGAIEVIVEFPNVPALSVGGFVTAAASLDAQALTTTVPTSALIRATGGDFVYTLSGDHFVRTPVKIGAVSGSRVSILDGLYSGDRVVSEPAMSLWLTELAAIKGGHACCVVPAKGK
ncbi:MAG: hypothetical protein WD941_06160 [Opitutus sp.]